MVIDVKTNGKLLNEDTIVYNKSKNCWEARSKEEYFNDFIVVIQKLSKEIKEMEERNKNLIEEMEVFKTKVNQKLKEHHDALSILVGNEGEDLL